MTVDEPGVYAGQPKAYVTSQTDTAQLLPENTKRSML